MKKILALSLILAFAAAASAELTQPVNLTFAAQEVGTGAYSVAAAIQSVLVKGLPQGSTIDLTTNSPGGVGAPERGLRPDRLQRRPLPLELRAHARSVSVWRL